MALLLKNTKDTTGQLQTEVLMIYPPELCKLEISSSGKASIKITPIVYLSLEAKNVGYNPIYFTHVTNYEGKICRCIYHYILPPCENPNLITVIYP